jgi:bifunctional non-homologous end joining protein LigD
MSPVVTIYGKKLKLTNLEKVLYPACGFTKAHVIDYYRKVAKYILPHLKDRPITLKRFPQGVEKDYFYEKQCPSHRPDWVQTGGKPEMEKDYCLVNDLPSLIWIANLASLEIHTLLARADNLNCPTMVVFDLDPGAPAALQECLEIALIMRQMFSDLSLRCFPKTSGGKGLHLYLPLNTPVTYDRTKAFAKTVAQTMEKFYPDRVISKMAKNIRNGKVFIDWSQNTRHKTTVCVYSLRAQQTPTVSMPVSWEQVEQAAKRKQAPQLIVNPQQALNMLKDSGDLFAEMETLHQQLPDVMPAAKKSKAASAVTATDSNLSTYQQKRNFAITPEPAAGTGNSPGSLFVIQKHAARRLHYDLRLEAEGVLKSWAVPKGPSSDPTEKRLAVQVEDHPFDYKDFEGRIPSGQYGAGRVIVWDQGTYENVTQNAKKHPISMSQALEKGKLEVVFHGQKVKGKYALVRMKTDENSHSNWLLIKKKDKHVNSLPYDLEQLSQSVITGNTLKQI